MDNYLIEELIQKRIDEATKDLKAELTEVKEENEKLKDNNLYKIVTNTYHTDFTSSKKVEYASKDELTKELKEAKDKVKELTPINDDLFNKNKNYKIQEEWLRERLVFADKKKDQADTYIRELQQRIDKFNYKPKLLRMFQDV